MRGARDEWPNMTARRRKKLVWAVKDFLECCEEEIAEIKDWDNGPSYVCDQMLDFLDMNSWTHEWPDGIWREGKFADQVSCCFRAGLDVASSPSAGVLGFDVGMLRRMWPRGVPAYVRNFFQPPLTNADPPTLGVWL